MPSWGLVPLRVALGLVFVVHGGQKLFVWGLAGTSTAMSHMGIPLPGVAATVVALVELGGGLAVLVGYLARPAGILLACDMAVAIAKVKLAGGFFAPRGFEYELVLLAGALSVALMGPGGLSLAEARRARAAAERASAERAPAAGDPSTIEETVAGGERPTGGGAAGGTPGMG